MCYDQSLTSQVHSTSNIMNVSVPSSNVICIWRGDLTVFKLQPLKTSMALVSCLKLIAQVSWFLSILFMIHPDIAFPHKQLHDQHHHHHHYYIVIINITVTITESFSCCFLHTAPHNFSWYLCSFWLKLLYCRLSDPQFDLSVEMVIHVLISSVHHIVCSETDLTCTADGT